jgi:hypothetical protein
MTSWIDASFVYSTKEAWVNAMRTFRNGTFKMEEGGDPILGMPPRNMDRIPLQNHPAPHVLRMLPPERMFREYTVFNKSFDTFFNGFISVVCALSILNTKSTGFSCPILSLLVYCE